MKGWWFLVPLKEIRYLEKIIKIKSILKKGLDIHKHKYHEILDLNDFDQLVKNIGQILDDVNNISLHEGSRKVADHVAGKGCCELSSFAIFTNPYIILV